MEKNYRLRIVRGGLEFEAEGDKKFVLEMLERFENTSPEAATTPAKPTKTAGSITVASRKTMSVREFIQRLEFKRHTERVLAFGYYLEKHARKADFSAADINNCYYEAKMEVSNTSQSIIRNIRAGRMMEAKSASKKKGARKRYTLTQTGEQFIEKAQQQKPA